MSRSYDAVSISEAIANLVSNDFDGTGFDVSHVEGAVTITTRLTLTLPDGWEFSGYDDSVEVETHIHV